MSTKTCKGCNRVYKDEKDYLQKTTRWRVCQSGNLWFNCSCNSTLVILKGKFEWYSPDKFMSKEASGVFNRMATLKELPHLPSSVLELQTMADDPECDGTQLVEALKQSPLIALNVLKMANNQQIGTGKPIDSLIHAVSYIGQKAVAELAIVASLKTLEMNTSNYTVDEFWNESHLTAAIAEHLSRRFGSSQIADKAYLAGTMCNIGKLAAGICMPDSTDKVFALTKDTKRLLSWQSAEKEVGAVGHQILGEIASVVWGMPDFVVDISAGHHEWDENSPSLVRIVTMANQLSHWINFSPSRMQEILLQQCADAFKVNPLELDKLADELMALKEKI